MSYKQKRHETPIELHRTLGNRHAIAVYERQQAKKKAAIRKKKKSEEHMMNMVMLNRQLVLEMELTQLRGQLLEAQQKPVPVEDKVETKEEISIKEDISDKQQHSIKGTIQMGSHKKLGKVFGVSSIQSTKERDAGSVKKLENQLGVDHLVAVSDAIGECEENDSSPPKLTKFEKLLGVDSGATTPNSRSPRSRAQSSAGSRTNLSEDAANLTTAPKITGMSSGDIMSKVAQAIQSSVHPYSPNNTTTSDDATKQPQRQPGSKPASPRGLGGGSAIVPSLPHEDEPGVAADQQQQLQQQQQSTSSSLSYTSAPVDADDGGDSAGARSGTKSATVAGANHTVPPAVSREEGPTGTSNYSNNNNNNNNNNSSSAAAGTGNSDVPAVRIRAPGEEPPQVQALPAVAGTISYQNTTRTGLGLSLISPEQLEQQHLQQQALASTIQLPGGMALTLPARAVNSNNNMHHSSNLAATAAAIAGMNLSSGAAGLGGTLGFNMGMGGIGGMVFGATAPTFGKSPPIVKQSKPLSATGAVKESDGKGKVKGKDTNNNSNTMFVLSAAPKLSFDTMLHQELALNNDSADKESLLSGSTVGFSNSMSIGENGIDGGGGSPPAWAAEAAVTGALPVDQTLSLQDQIIRFAELRSLFQLPTKLEEDNPFLLNGGEEIGAGEAEGKRGSGSNQEYDEQHQHRNEEAYLRHIRKVDQLNAKEELLDMRLQGDIEKHKQRLQKARAAPRCYSPPNGAAAAAAAVNNNHPNNNNTNPSPRTKLYKIRHPTYVPGESEYFRSTRSVLVAEDGTTIVESADVTAKLAQRALPPPTSPPPKSGNKNGVRPGAVLKLASDSSSAQQEAKQQEASADATNPTVPRQSSNAGSDPQQQQQQQQQGAAEGGAVMKEATPQNGDGTAAAVEPNATTVTTTTTTTAEGAKDAATVGEDGGREGGDEEGVPATNTEVPEVSVDDFLDATGRIEEALEAAIEDIVAEEIIIDGESQHFTRRFQEVTLAKSKKPLMVKIQTKVEEKIAELRRELDALKEVKLADYDSDVSGASGTYYSDEEEEGDAEKAADGDAPWHKRNELDKSSPTGVKGPKAGRDKREGPAAGKSPRAPGDTSTSDRHHKRSPRAYSHHHHHHHKHETELDMESVSLDLKHSLESIIKKHITSIKVTTARSNANSEAGDSVPRKEPGDSREEGGEGGEEDDEAEALEKSFGMTSVDEAQAEEERAAAEKKKAKEEAAAAEKKKKDDADAEAAILASLKAEEEVKPRKLTKAERMLGITEPGGAPPGGSGGPGGGGAGPMGGKDARDASGKAGLLGSLGSFFGSKATASSSASGGVSPGRPGSSQVASPAAALPPIHGSGAVKSSMRFMGGEKPAGSAAAGAAGNKLGSNSKLGAVDDETASQHSITSRGSRTSKGKSKKGKKGPVNRTIGDSSDGNINAAFAAALNTSESDSTQNAEALRDAEGELQRANDILSELNASKSALKQELKEWQRDFEMRVGRPPSDADKSILEDRFMAYQKVTGDVKQAAKMVSSLEDRLNKLRSESQQPP